MGVGGRDDADDDFVVFEIHSANPIHVEVVQRGIDWYRRVLVCQTMAADDAAGEPGPRTGLAEHLYTMSESAGVRLALVNASSDRCLNLSVQMKELRYCGKLLAVFRVYLLLMYNFCCSGLFHSRAPLASDVASVSTTDLLPPQSATLAVVLSQAAPGIARGWAMSAKSTSTAAGAAVLQPTTAPGSSPGVSLGGIHFPWKFVNAAR